MSQEVRDNTIIIFIGDNGSPNKVAQEFNSMRVKGSVYKGGINVPMYISGKGVSRTSVQENALINSTDLFATIANIAGINVTDINDSKSFKSLFTGDNSNPREYIYAEIGKDTGGSDYTIRNETHKYIKFDNGNEALYNLSTNSMENPNLMSTNQLPLSSSDEVIGFNSAKYDKTYSEGLGLTATRSLGETSSLMINTSFTDSDQREETADDFESYGLTLALDTSLGNQSLSPYIMISKTDYQDDADSFSLMQGIGGFFSVGDQNSFSYGYSFSDSKNNRNSSDTTANETNAKGHGVSLGHDYLFNEIISSSTGLGYSISEAKEGTNDFETYDLSFRLNFAFPWAYISVGDALSFNDYKNVDTSINSNRIRSDVTNTFDLMLTKALGDFFPSIDPDKSLFVNFSYEKIISEANIINYDYIADSFALSLSKSFHLNK
jgi:hypothetical protein